MPEVVRAALLSLGFTEVPSEHSCSGVEYQRRGVAVYQTSARQWCIDAPEDETMQALITGMNAKDTTLHTLGVVLDATN